MKTCPWDRKCCHKVSIVALTMQFLQSPVVSCCYTYFVESRYKIVNHRDMVSAGNHTKATSTGTADGGKSQTTGRLVFTLTATITICLGLASQPAPVISAALGSDVPNFTIPLFQFAISSRWYRKGELAGARQTMLGTSHPPTYYTPLTNQHPSTFAWFRCGKH